MSRTGAARREVHPEVRFVQLDAGGRILWHKLRTALLNCTFGIFRFAFFIIGPSLNLVPKRVATGK